MNRCHAPSHPPLARRTLCHWVWAAPLWALALTAAAQINLRAFPPSAQRGTLVVIAPPVVQLNGQAERLSPGARIRGMNNLLQLSGSLIGQSLLVNFVRNPLGELHEVWVLTEAEAALKLPTPTP